MLKKLLTVPISWLYGLGVNFRNWLYDNNFIKSTEFDIPVVCVGNLTVGGTGKTPHVEYLISTLSKEYNVAIISRGYKRKTSGYILVETEHSSSQVGDEPKQIKLKYPNIPIAVCANRTEGINKLRSQFPNLNLIIMDDGMQHRKVETWLNVLLMDFNRPIYSDYFMPNGTLRDSRSRLSAGQIIVVTKCPKNLQPIDMRLILKNLELLGYQSLFFTRMKNIRPKPIFPEVAQNTRPIQSGDNVIAMSGIGNPIHFSQSLSSEFNVVDSIIFPDHHSYRTRDLVTMTNALTNRSDTTYIVTTEKDAVKLFKSTKIPESIKKRLYYQTIEVEFVETFKNSNEESFNETISMYVKKNHKYTMLN